MRRLALAMALTLTAGAAPGEPPQSSPRPETRQAGPAPQVRQVQAEAGEGSPWYDVKISPRPRKRAAEVLERAKGAAQAVPGGGVCGDPKIQGDYLGTVGGPGACGVENAVKVRAVAGVKLSRPATIDCQTARTLREWVETGARPTVGGEGGGIASLRVVAHYSCRQRRGTSSSKMSEHSFGHAIDIAGIGLRDGSEISVLDGWGTRDDGAQLRRMHRAACGPFGTVLGPSANAAHHDHFHFDTARYRSGSYCR